MQRLLYAALLTLLCNGPVLARASAQPPMHKLSVAPELALALDSTYVAAPVPAPPRANATPADREALHKLRRSRVMAALGIGMAAAGIAGIAAGIHGQQCYGSGEREPNPGWAIAGASFTAIGLSLSISGLIRAHSDRSLTPTRAWVAPVALGALAISTGLWFVAGVGKWVGCVSS
jgi:hypothetical protein